MLEQGVDIEIMDGCNKLLVSFGGINNAPGLPVSEFKSTLKNVKINKIFLVDIHRSWYYFGINNKLNSHYKLKLYLNELLSKYGKEYIMFYGNSMGGFAAILFGSMLSVNRVVAFAPQTFLSQELRKECNDTRWENDLKKIFGRFNDEELRLINLLNKSNKTTIYDIYFCRQDKLDNAHVGELIGLSNFRFHPYNFGGHSLVKVLRDSGKLRNILLEDINYE